MEKIRLAITGQNGFIGSRLYRKAVVDGRFELTDVPRDLFHAPAELKRTLEQTDAVVHLAGLSRAADGEMLYRENVRLSRVLAGACTGNQILYLGSTTHEKKDLPYHASKRESRRIFEERGRDKCGILLMANTFGPGSRPFYNSVVSTFCRMAADGTEPETVQDVMLQLIYVDDLCREILKAVRERRTGEIVIPHTFEIALPELWKKLQTWRKETPSLFSSRFEIQLFETAESYRS